MELSELLKELDALNLPEDQYVITSSAAMAIRDIPREIKDLDIVVSDSLWEELAQKYGVIDKPFKRIKLSENIEALGSGSHFVDPRVATPDKLLVDPEFIDGRAYVNLETLREFKALGTREKDIADVKILDEYLAQHRK